MHFQQSLHTVRAQRNRQDHRHRLQRQLRLWSAMSVLSVTCFSLGCSGYSAAEHRVDALLACDTLEKILVQWQQGNTPEDCLTLTPPVVVQDMDWKSGVKLQAFEIIEPGEARDANYYCQVKILLQSAEHGERSKNVTYLVGTSPVLTVFRSPAP